MAQDCTRAIGSQAQNQVSGLKLYQYQIFLSFDFPQGQSALLKGFVKREKRPAKGRREPISEANLGREVMVERMASFVLVLDAMNRARNPPKREGASRLSRNGNLR
jgi:hypothetical protein